MSVTPYYSEPGITIYCGDCREILPQLGPVDLVLTDPPYVGLKGGYKRDFQGGVGAKVSISESFGDPWGASLAWIPAVARLARLGMFVFCGGGSLLETADALKPHGKLELVVWYKRNSCPTGANVPYFMAEYVWSVKRAVGLDWGKLRTVYDIPNINAGCMATERIVTDTGHAVHPCQKPIALIGELMKVGGETILDPFMGSGTTLVAAKQLGRKAIGIEIEPRYCDIAIERLRQDVLPLVPEAPREQEQMSLV
jgi:site-specific DNA-methyltransferase (adenine-specific)